MNGSVAAILGLGFSLGLKHATEADHLAAISSIVSERHSVWQSASVGLLWGVGTHRRAPCCRLLRDCCWHCNSRARRKPPRTGRRADDHLSGNAPPIPSGLSGWRPVLVGVVHGLAG